VRTPRSFSALAMFCRPLTPAAWICRTIGSTFAAKASAVGLVRLGLRPAEGSPRVGLLMHSPLWQSGPFDSPQCEIGRLGFNSRRGHAFGDNHSRQS
jgi:hypothetical protein